MLVKDLIKHLENCEENHEVWIYCERVEVPIEKITINNHHKKTWIDGEDYDD